MKTKLFFVLVAVCSTVIASAQKPFKDIGKDDEVEVLTVSNGRYVEYFTYDTLRQIGSVMFNTQTHKVQYFIPQDDTAKQRVIARSKETSRFMSVDPMAKNFPWNSPYAFAENDVIRSIDLDGLEKYFATDFKNANGEIYKTVITIVGPAQVNNGIQNIEVYRSEVQYDSKGNATISYKGRSVAVATINNNNTPVINPLQAFNSQQEVDEAMKKRTASIDNKQFLMKESGSGAMKGQGSSFEIKNEGIAVPDPKKSVYIKPEEANAVPYDKDKLPSAANAKIMGGNGSIKVLSNQPTMGENNQGQNAGNKTITINPTKEDK